ncbi:MAG: hypothetical protein EOO28_14615 [Comamonadaceae bacterium]|nr:MAG: hypothetical protein EOO28_14615 [Comamonadaceae bacterium]
MNRSEKSREVLPEPPASSGVDAKATTDTGYGVEGTNKTIPVPVDDANASEDLVNTTTKHIEKSPYTRG